jgi:hypothetical protein
MWGRFYFTDTKSMDALDAVVVEATVRMKLKERASVAMVFVLVIAAAQNASALTTPKNESSLQIAGENEKDIWYDRSSGHDVNLIKLCKGSVPKEVDLKSAGLSAEDLKSGVSCVTADFDKNGFLDFVLYGKSETSLVGGNEVPNGVSLLVLFYKGKELMKTQLIHRAAQVRVFEPSDPDRANYPKRDASYPALIRPGEGDRGYVYFFNPKTSLFEEDHWMAPPGYEMGD